MKREVIKTADGSSTIYLPELDETYHSRHGAIQEAEHVFIKNGLENIASDNIHILEVGFGTGLNAFLTCLWANEKHIEINYTGLEAYPVSSEMAKECEYARNQSEENILKKLHLIEWDRLTAITPYFNLKKKEVKLELYETSDSFHIIYFDAFGKRAQPEMWNINMLQRCTKHLIKGGIFVTYSANGQLKRDLKALNLEVKSVPGPPGKREMVVATLK